MPEACGATVIVVMIAALTYLTAEVNQQFGIALCVVCGFTVLLLGYITIRALGADD